jgi:iron complex transport system ATP-binding protein
MKLKPLEAQGISFSFEPQKPVLHQVSFALEMGEMLGVIGPNGSGKSTLIRILSNALVPESGQILVKEMAIQKFSRKELARKIAVIPQQSQVDFPFRVLEVVLMGRAPYLKRFELESKRDLDIAKAALASTDCLDLGERLLDEISGGEKQRVILARALAQEPEILLADEPTTYLDLHHQMKFMSLLSDLRRRNNISILFSTHDLNLASLFADRILVLDRGRVAGLGMPEEVLEADMISKIYGIRLKAVSRTLSKKPLLVPELDSDMILLTNLCHKI